LNQFRNRRVLSAAAVSVAVLIPLLVFGAPALARSVAAAAEYEYGGSAQYKVAICHHTHSKKHPFHVINVAAAAVKAHLRHGDTLAPCPTTAPPQAGKHGKGKGHGQGNGNDNKGTGPTTSPTAPTTGGDQHGKSGDDHGKSGDEHGNSGDHGNGGGNGKGHGH